MHTFKVQAKGIQLNFDTSSISVYKSDKPDSKAGGSLGDVQTKLVTFNTLHSQR